MFNYWAYGLRVSSEIHFPELFAIESSSAFDVCIELGVVPIHPNENTETFGQNIFIDEARFKLEIPKVASYWAANGTHVIVEKHNDSNEDEVRLFCLSNIFAAILYQRRIIPLHAASVKFNDQLVLVCGKSGAGKSTLLASLISRGYEVFADDVCVPHLDSTNAVLINASYPMMKFWRDESFGFPIANSPDIQLRPEVNKYGFFFHQKFDRLALRPALVFFIEKIEEDKDMTIDEIKGVELFQHLISNVYRAELFGGYDLSSYRFSLFGNLANQIRGYVIKRPSIGDTVNFICEQVEKIIQNNFQNEHKVHSK